MQTGLMNTLQLLEKTVKGGKEYQSRWRWEVEGNPEWQIPTSYWRDSPEPEDDNENPESFEKSNLGHPGKLIVVERTYTERIVASYDITPDGNLTPIRKES